MSQEIAVINLEDKFGLFTAHWSPRIIGQVNDMHVKIVRIQGEFDWHHHETEDELFLVVRGEMHMHLRDRVAIVRPGEMIIIPQKVEHKPAAPEETWIMMFEPATTLNTGTEETARTVIPDWL
jgi:mannose-6-phosphate isomerase-like protein (cupin superfamily)